mgnify:CR=1 FL=1
MVEVDSPPDCLLWIPATITVSITIHEIELGRRDDSGHGNATRGEQPFTALIETQFAEQPPQKDDPGLPNRGRKVLVFSDGRQKAARLAPALETSHMQDTFRQVLALAVVELARLGLFLGRVLLDTHGGGLTVIDAPGHPLDGEWAATGFTRGLGEDFHVPFIVSAARIGGQRSLSATTWYEQLLREGARAAGPTT